MCLTCRKAVRASGINSGAMRTGQDGCRKQQGGYSGFHKDDTFSMHITMTTVPTEILCLAGESSVVRGLRSL